MTLSPRDEAILEFERTWGNEPGSKDEAVARRFLLTPAEYVDALDTLIDSECAVVHDERFGSCNRGRMCTASVRSHWRACGDERHSLDGEELGLRRGASAEGRFKRLGLDKR